MKAPAAGPAWVSTTNPCKACTPLGAALAFHGVEGAVCLLHGSQGCSTYIRRYLIGHFREPLDIASSNFSEDSAVFGGRRNFLGALENLQRQYQPGLVGVATTCLAETMGEDVGLFLHEVKDRVAAGTLAPVVSVSTPSYSGTHAEGYQAALRALVDQLPDPNVPGAGPGVVVLAPLVSPEDLRFLRQSLADFGLAGTLVPDWSDTLDGGPWDEYQPLPPGGTPLTALRTLDRATGWVELGEVLSLTTETAGTVLGARSGAAGHRLAWPLGVGNTDAYFAALAEFARRPVPAPIRSARGRLIDALVDGHKVVSGLRVAVYGEEDLTVALASFLAEAGARVVAVATGGASGRLEAALKAVLGPDHGALVIDDGDFFDLETSLPEGSVDLLVGGSKGYKLARARGVPLVRVGFPVHDRFGGARIRLLGYAGTLELYDRIVNAVLEHRQAQNPAGYTYY